MRDKMTDMKVIVWSKADGRTEGNCLSQSRGHNKGQDSRQQGHDVGQGWSIMRDKMADKKVIVWARLADKKVIVWAKMWGIMKDKIAD